MQRLPKTYRLIEGARFCIVLPHIRSDRPMSIAPLLSWISSKSPPQAYRQQVAPRFQTRSAGANGNRRSNFPEAGQPIDVYSSVAISVFIATNPEALLPHGIASTPPLGAHLLTPNNFRRGAGLGDQSLREPGLRTCFRSAASNGGEQDKKRLPATLPLGWKNGPSLIRW